MNNSLIDAVQIARRKAHDAKEAALAAVAVRHRASLALEAGRREQAAHLECELNREASSAQAALMALRSGTAAPDTAEADQAAATTSLRLAARVRIAEAVMAQAAADLAQAEAEAAQAEADVERVARDGLLSEASDLWRQCLDHAHRAERLRHQLLGVYRALGTLPAGCWPWLNEMEVPGPLLRARGMDGRVPESLSLSEAEADRIAASTCEEVRRRFSELVIDDSDPQLTKAA